MGVSEFQAIVMAGGKGSRMTELTARRPKCLLPIGNMPLIWYPLRLLERSGFNEVIIVVLESVKNDVQSVIESTGLKIHLDIIGIPVGEDWGTADSLRHLEDNNKIKSDVVVVSCDLITDVDLSGLLNLFRCHDASLSSLFFQPTTSSVVLPTPGPKTKDKIERDIVAIDPVTSRLLFLASASDYEETFSMSRSLLRKHSRIRLHSKLLDAHVYVLKRCLCRYLTHNRNMITLKGELIPYAVKKQFSPLISKQEDKAASVVVTNPKTELMDLAEENHLTKKVREMSNYNDHCGDKSGAYHGDPLRCYAYVSPDSSFATRANTLQEYCRINREIISRWPALTGGLDLLPIATTAQVLSNQLETESCLVGEQAEVAERTAIKASIIGSHTTVKTKTRVFNSIIMAGAKIGEGCALVNCVLCDDCVVENGCELKDCLVGSNHTVPARDNHSKEVLTDDDHLIEIV